MMFSYDYNTVLHKQQTLQQYIRTLYIPLARPMTELVWVQLKAEWKWGEEVQVNSEYCVQLGGYSCLHFWTVEGVENFFVESEICQ